MTALLRVSDISKRFAGANRAALDDVSFEVEDQELVTLVGASGSGKTSLLRIVAGLETADAGTVCLGDDLLTRGPRILVPPEHRHIGLVFQNHALFPHLRVRENVAFGLPKGPGRNQGVRDLLNLVGLENLAERYPHELSGGERQRIALVRALAPHPRLLLMDEPFSSLDESLRRELRDQSRRLLKQRCATTILVTHDSEDALAVSDRIVVLREGMVQQIGSPADIYRQPANRYIASSFGPCNFLVRAELSAGDALGGRPGIEPEDRSGEEIWIRPEDLKLSRGGKEPCLASGVVSESLFHGESRLVTLECHSPLGRQFAVQVRLHGEGSARPGDQWEVHLAVPDGHAVATNAAL